MPVEVLVGIRDEDAGSIEDGVGEPLPNNVKFEATGRDFPGQVLHSPHDLFKAIEG